MTLKNCTKDSGAELARLLVRLLLGRMQVSDTARWREVDRADLLRLAQKNVVVIRTFEALKRLGIELADEDFAQTAFSERERIRQTIDAIKFVGGACNEMGLPYVLLKSFQHYPDMGGDIDLLVLDRSRRLDDHLISCHGATRLTKNSFFNVVSGKSDLVLNGCRTSVEVHHGRMGHAGEYGRYPYLLAERSGAFEVDGLNVPVPSLEDQLLIHVIQRIYGHFYIRISDLVGSVRLIEQGALDWRRFVDTARRLGIFEGARMYIAIINEICVDATGYPMKVPAVEGIDVGRGPHGACFSGAYYRYPLLPVTAKVYFAKAMSDLRTGQISSVARLCLIPPVGAIHLGRNVVKRRSRIFDQ